MLKHCRRCHCWRRLTFCPCFLGVLLLLRREGLALRDAVLQKSIMGALFIMQKHEAARYT